MDPKTFDWQKELSGAVAVGDVIADKYRIEGLVGVGGMGIVLEARHVKLDERVAIKFLMPKRLSSPKARQRFDREARAAFRIRSEHVARVFDVGEVADEIPYMVMEYLSGRSLADVLAEDGPLEVPTAILYMLQACDAVAQAHALNIVHRDLKPANLFLTDRPDGSPCVKVLDFGIAKAQEQNGSLTTVDQFMGTPMYTSPEQWLSARDVGPATDIWALGAILFRLLTGRGPYRADDAAQLRDMVLMQPAPSLADVRPDVPPGLVAVVARCLERSPQQRFANAPSLSEALAEYASVPAGLGGLTPQSSRRPLAGGTETASPRRDVPTDLETAEHRPPEGARDADESATLLESPHQRARRLAIEPAAESGTIRMKPEEGTITEDADETAEDEASTIRRPPPPRAPAMGSEAPTVVRRGGSALAVPGLDTERYGAPEPASARGPAHSRRSFGRLVAVVAVVIALALYLASRCGPSATSPENIDRAPQELE
ncbi:MAG: serine/threonine protein kinase [Deltaproteobacteria bacterium]|jgi:serine/threonine-protein kinase|nr:serine/threonine protein kinase [Deltaproteobacteria bacterium]MBW2537376.1 serine/threonine protein kinase [Deltaproteobacteria bacterium]